MQRRPFVRSLMTALSVVLATSMLAACGPGDGASSQAAVANAPTRSDKAAQAPDSTAILPRATLAPGLAATNSAANGSGTSDSNATNATSAADFASNAVGVVQASLAADSQQVAPILSYAPGDGPPTGTNTGNATSSTATTSQ